MGDGGSANHPKCSSEIMGGSSKIKEGSSKIRAGFVENNDCSSKIKISGLLFKKGTQETKLEQKTSGAAKHELSTHFYSNSAISEFVENDDAYQPMFVENYALHVNSGF